MLLLLQFVPLKVCLPGGLVMEEEPERGRSAPILPASQDFSLISNREGRK